MRYSAEHKQQTRERVLKAAADMIRAEGVTEVGVAGVMAKVGLTHGGFYSHFASRDAFIAAAIETMFLEGAARLARSLEGRTPIEGLRDYLDFYLSTGHRDTRTAGCPLPFLTVDAARMDAPTRKQVADGAQALTDGLTKALSAAGVADAADEAGSVLSEMVGAVTLARAEPDVERSNAILQRTHRAVYRRLGLNHA